MISQGISHTAYDVMREYMIIGAELDGKYQIPMLDRYTGHPGEDTVDFKDSFSPKIKNHRKLTVNFYIHDYEFEKIWNNPDRYLEHLKCFHSVIGPDFSMAVVYEMSLPYLGTVYPELANPDAEMKKAQELIKDFSQKSIQNQSATISSTGEE